MRNDAYKMGFANRGNLHHFSNAADVGQGGADEINVVIFNQLVEVPPVAPFLARSQRNVHFLAQDRKVLQEGLRADRIFDEEWSQVLVRPSDRAVAGYGEGIYAPTLTEATYAELLHRAEVATSRGESVVLDASWGSAPQRERARCLARATSSDLVELCCACPADLAAGRLTQRLALGVDASDATVEVAERMRADFAPWPGAHVIDTSQPIDGSVRAALRWLGGARQGGD